MQNISGFGLLVNVIASSTFPFGVTWSQFADDADPFDLNSIQVAEAVMGLNGDLLTYAKANPIKIILNLVPGGDDDISAGIILENNRPGKGKSPVNDIITMTGIYPDGRIITLINGIITDGMPGNAISSSGRMKSKNYAFSFENKISTF